jgi:hypothetical protein
MGALEDVEWLAGNTPLHIVCISNASQEVIKYLATEWPNAREETNDDGKKQRYYALDTRILGSMRGSLLRMMESAKRYFIFVISILMTLSINMLVSNTCQSL